jgi:ankyrin repeat protein
MRTLRIEKETYLNLFLTTIVCRRSGEPHFGKYIDLLVNFKFITNKKSADINYVGYKDSKSILMHACMHGNVENIEHLLTIPNLNMNLRDPTGKNALFYAVNNPNENNSTAIINLLLST